MLSYINVFFVTSKRDKFLITKKTHTIS